MRKEQVELPIGLVELAGLEEKLLGMVRIARSCVEDGQPIASLGRARRPAQRALFVEGQRGRLELVSTDELRAIPEAFAGQGLAEPSMVAHSMYNTFVFTLLATYALV